MSFRLNSGTQISFMDRFKNLPQEYQRLIHGSWAEAFSTEVFPAIDEKPFAVLYSGDAGRPNAPINVMVGALILKEIFGLSDKEVVESLHFDIRFQYALHATSYEDQPLSKRTMRRFREKLSHHEEETGVDLFQQCVHGLSEPIAKVMEISSNVRCMDS